MIKIQKINVFEKNYKYEFFSYYVEKIGGSKDLLHFHDNYEIFFSLTNQGKVIVNDNEFDLEYGDIFIFNNLDIHQFIVPNDLLYKRYVIMFNPNFISGVSTERFNLLNLFEYNSKDFTHKLSKTAYESLISTEEFIEYFEKINRIFENISDPMNEIRLKLIFSDFLLTLSQAYSRNTHYLLRKSNLNIDFIQKIIKYIHENLKEELSLDNLSKEFFINKFYLSHSFSNFTGVSVKQYILKQRLQTALNLYKEGELDGTKICSEVGFNNYSHFLRSFKNFYGESPTNYIKKYK